MRPTAVGGTFGAMSKPRHSESVLSDLRDEWWRREYLELVANRIALSAATRVLDVGCGQGHWGFLLLSTLSDEAQLVGVDQEGDWVAKAEAKAAALGVGERTRFTQGQAEELPFEDNSFDLVTCQTLVMHVARPKDVLAEMHRVLTPGGRLLLAEPSNLPNQFSTNSVNRALTPEELAELSYLLVCCSRGRAALGRGDDSIGDVLPMLLQETGFGELEVFQNERANVIVPPYEGAVRGQLEEELGHQKRGFWLWDRADAFSLFSAGGGIETRFERAYEVFLKRTDVFREQVEAGTYSRSGGGHHYLFAARPLGAVQS